MSVPVSKTSSKEVGEEPLQLSTEDVEKAVAAIPEGVVEHNPRANLPGWKWIATLVGLYMGALLYGLDTTIAADVQVPVYQRFQDIEKLPWVGVGFPMASVAVILPVGKAYGLFDVKWLLIASIIIFEAGSALCGAAPSSEALIVGRAIAGMGGAGMYLGALTYISVFTTVRESMLYNALTGVCWGCGAILGPVIGGSFADSSATWRWAFYINLPLAGVLAPVYFFVLPSHNPKPNVSVLDRLREIDWVGSFLNSGSFVLFIIVVSFSGSTYAWGSGASIALWVVWGVFVIAYIVQQYFCLFTTPELRIFPAEFLKSRTLVLLYMVTSAAATGMVGVYYIPLYFQFTHGDSALKAAVRLLPFICVFIFFIMFSGGALPAVGRYAPFYLIGGIFVTIGSALMFTIDANTNVQKIYGYEVLMAAGAGLTFQNAYAVAASKVEDKKKADAIGFINVSQIGSAALVLAITGSLFQNIGFNDLKSALSSYNFPDDYVRSALAGTISPVFTSGNEEVAQIAVQTVAKTIAKVFGTVIGGGALLIVGSLGLKWEKVRLEVVAGG